ncbi:MAG: aminomethyl-transferring glycine dehydrogenase subunit GcvPB [Bdellovibrionales bacterium]|nr:aminomethyl-transferring glycine dehydrogenase subunit GcvPB [Bdellovibrionales bacterium]
MAEKDYHSHATTGLILREDTIFERSSSGREGYRLPNLEVPEVSPKSLRRSHPAELPEVGELDVVRHFTRLSSWNYSIDTGMFPLGSCTMKYNPRINEEVAALPGLSDIHPDAPAEVSQGALEIIYQMERLLCEIAGLDACTTQPAAGAVGEFTGLALVHAFHKHHGSRRKYVLVPDTAHGTNPASCTLAGYETITLPSSKTGVLGVDTVREAVEKYGRDIAAIMITNPNTLGLFETNILEISEVVHSVGAQVYMDGANMNAIVGMAKPGHMGVDVMHFNLHKTFSTPHGGGGPGAGPVAVREHLAPYLPNPRVVHTDSKYSVEYLPESIGKVKGAFGNFGMLVRALCYIRHHGAEGLRAIARASVLNANYLKHQLSKRFKLSHDAPSFHEFVVSDALQAKVGGVKTLQIAKALMDRGFHPPTIYFPLVVPGAMLIEPTETESLQDLDRFIAAMNDIADRIESGEETFADAPTKTIVGKVDEALAARRPVLSLDDRAL